MLRTRLFVVSSLWLTGLCLIGAAQTSMPPMDIYESRGEAMDAEAQDYQRIEGSLDAQGRQADADFNKQSAACGNDMQCYRAALTRWKTKWDEIKANKKAEQQIHDDRVNQIGKYWDKKASDMGRTKQDRRQKR